jgi:hypothetical protein
MKAKGVMERLSFFWIPYVIPVRAGMAIGVENNNVV